MTHVHSVVGKWLETMNSIDPMHGRCVYVVYGLDAIRGWVRDVILQYDVVRHLVLDLGKHGENVKPGSSEGRQLSVCSLSSLNKFSSDT